MLTKIYRDCNGLDWYCDKGEPEITSDCSAADGGQSDAQALAEDPKRSADRPRKNPDRKLSKRELLLHIQTFAEAILERVKDLDSAAD